MLILCHLAPDVIEEVQSPVVCAVSAFILYVSIQLSLYSESEEERRYCLSVQIYVGNEQFKLLPALHCTMTVPNKACVCVKV